MTETLALLALTGVVGCARPPRPLIEQRTAAIARRTARVVFALALGSTGVGLIRARRCVTVAHPLPTDGNIFERIKEAPEEGAVI